MRGSSVVLITAGVMLTSTTSALLLRIWLERRSFDMAARSPVLLIFVAVASLTMAVLVLLHWFLLLEGRGLGLPCYATFIASYFCEFWRALRRQKQPRISREKIDPSVPKRSCYRSSPSVILRSILTTRANHVGTGYPITVVLGTAFGRAGSNCACYPPRWTDCAARFLDLRGLKAEAALTQYFPRCWQNAKSHLLVNTTSLPSSVHLPLGARDIS